MSRRERRLDIRATVPWIDRGRLLFSEGMLPCKSRWTDPFDSATNGVKVPWKRSGFVLRLAVVALVVAVSGCVASTVPAPLPAPAPEDGFAVMATRVEALVHAVDARGRIESQLCDARTPDCRAPTAFDWPRPTFDFADPLALFWRVSVQVTWDSQAPRDGLELTVYATKPCGIDCIRERKVGTAGDVEVPRLQDFDIYLQPGETGVRLRLQPVGSMEAAWGEAGITYHVQGAVGGYRAVADPVRIA